MKLWQLLLQSSVSRAIGWTIFHSLWEGAAIAIVVVFLLPKLRSATARYNVACGALLILAVSFAITFGSVLPSSLRFGSVNILSLGTEDMFPRMPGQLPAATYGDPAALLPWLAPFWLTGVLFFQFRALTSWIGVRRLRHKGVCFAPDFWQKSFAQLRNRFLGPEPVLLLESCFADVPVVIGHLRPVILFPFGMLSGLPTQQIEAILLHELAHIRRRDYLVNLLQTAVESLLFYHPAIWWISGVIRAERENCCDDFVVLAQGNRYEYAAALTALEEKRVTAKQSVLAANGGNLMKRVRRLLYPLESPRPAFAPVFSAAILTLAATVALFAWQSKPAAQPPAADTYATWLNQDVSYIITDAERAAFEKLGSDKERDMFITQFWERRDPTPGTVPNEFKEEHYRRLAFANSHYSSPSGFSPGWKTDRGRIYITYGPPDEIESHPSGGAYRVPEEQGGGERKTVPFEQWLYRYIEGVGNKVIVEFVDKSGTGDFQMTTDPAAKYQAP